MREQKDRCIFFVLENFFFLIPLPFVDKVIENSLPEEREPETEFIDLWAESGKNSKNKYCILINCKEEKFGVPAAEIPGYSRRAGVGIDGAGASEEEPVFVCCPRNAAGGWAEGAGLSAGCG